MTHQYQEISRAMHSFRAKRKTNPRVFLLPNGSLGALIQTGQIDLEVGLLAHCDVIESDRGEILLLCDEWCDENEAPHPKEIMFA